MSTCEICESRKVFFFHKIQNFSYNWCKSCNTLFLKPKPTQKEINNYYKKGFKYTAGEINEEQISQRANLILKNLIKLNPTGKSLLDIGSGYGYFLNKANKAGLTIFGIEPSQELYSASIKRLIEANIFNVSFADYYRKYRNKKFDFITVIHTIEHVLDPAETIHKALKLLKPDGILFLETPNFDSHLFKTELYNYTFLTPPDHIWIFSKNSFKNILLKEKAAKIELISSYSSPEHFMGIIKKILNTKYSINEKLKQKNSSDKIVNANLRSKYQLSNIKYLLIDKLLAPVFTPILNLGIYGSILELYIRKK